jgi:hypothetical protein
VAGQGSGNGDSCGRIPFVTPAVPNTLATEGIDGAGWSGRGVEHRGSVCVCVCVGGGGWRSIKRMQKKAMVVWWWARLCVVFPDHCETAPPHSTIVIHAHKSVHAPVCEEGGGERGGCVAVNLELVQIL